MKSFNEQNQDYIFELMKKYKALAKNQQIIINLIQNELKECNCRQGANNEGQKH